MSTIAVKEFKSKLSELLNQISESGEPVFITKHGKIVAKLMPCDEQSAWDEIAESMKGSVKKYVDPTEPVGLNDWEAL